MEIICKRRCFDANGSQYIIGGKYKWYETEYVYMVPYNEKLYNIYMEVNGTDIFMGAGSSIFIDYHFESDKTIEMDMVSCICLSNIFGPNARRYKENDYYKYSLRQVRYEMGDDREYVMYSDSGVWMGFVKKSFIEKNFIKYTEYFKELLEVDNLFNSYLSYDR